MCPGRDILDIRLHAGKYLRLVLQGYQTGVQSLDRKSGSREEDEVSGFFVLSYLWMRDYFRSG